MRALITAGLLVLLALWALARYRALVTMRRDLVRRWRLLEGHLARRRDLVAKAEGAAGTDGVRGTEPDVADIDRAIAAEARSYNERAARYNQAIEAMPTSIIAGLAGFTRADPFTSTPDA